MRKDTLYAIQLLGKVG